MTDVNEKPRVLLGPMNFANMPMEITRNLQKKGYYIHHLAYSTGRGHKFGYDLDREINVRNFKNVQHAQRQTLYDVLEEGFDVFHFWNKSLIFNGDYTGSTGIDLPIIKSYGGKIIHRFTGFDLRTKTEDMAFNPHSPFRYGYNFPVDDKAQRRFLSLVQDYADELLVQDPELGQFMPQAKIIPRALDLTQWQIPRDLEANPRPLVIHAPSNDVVKGTPQILQAVEELQKEGLNFDFKILRNMSHEEVRNTLKKADIVVDQILIGATGVLTLEAWALGKCVVVNLRDELFRDFYNVGELPIGNANPDNIKSVLKDLLKDPEKRQELGQRARELVVEFHDIDRVIPQFEALYQEVHDRPIKLAKDPQNAMNLYSPIIEVSDRLTEPGELLKLNKKALKLQVLKIIYQMRNIKKRVSKKIANARVKIKRFFLRNTKFIRKKIANARVKIKRFFLRNTKFARKKIANARVKLGRFFLRNTKFARKKIANARVKLGRFFLGNTKFVRKKIANVRVKLGRFFLRNTKFARKKMANARVKLGRFFLGNTKFVRKKIANARVKLGRFFYVILSL